jgi:hypothetical protein
MPVTTVRVYPSKQEEPIALGGALGAKKEQKQNHAVYYTDCITYHAMLPLLKVMKVFGLYHTRHSRNGSTCSVFYCAGICFLLLTQAVRALLLFDSNFRSWYLKNKAPEFMVDFHNLIVDCEVKHQCYAQKLRKRTLIVTLIATGFIVSNTVVFAYFFATTNTLDNLFSPLQKFEGYPDWVRILVATLVTANLAYTSACWCLPLAFGHSISYAVRSELKCFNYSFNDRIDKNGAFDGDISDYRQLF